MGSNPIDKKDLKTILSAGIRVPDHGSLNPWKLIVIEGKTLSKQASGAHDLAHSHTKGRTVKHASEAHDPAHSHTKEQSLKHMI